MYLYGEMIFCDSAMDGWMDGWAEGDVFSCRYQIPPQPQIIVIQLIWRAVWNGTYYLVLVIQFQRIVVL